ncbi:MAG: ATP-binding protein [Candidatus Zixiibacteriota bacterium]|nr:MAG: ATP-binding protein [candidate division Zixibacteria bacterium]
MLSKTEEKYRIEVPSGLSGGNAEAFYDRLKSLLKDHPPVVILDCSSLRQVSSRHINILWEARLMAQESKVRVGLASVSSNLARVLKVLDLYDLFLTDTPEVNPEATPEVQLHLQYDENALQLKLKAQTSAVKRALAEFHRYLKKINLPEAYAFELETVFYEVATNICTHAQVADDEVITFVAEPLPGKITMHFIDPGLPFDPTTIADEFDPDLARGKRQKRGYGLTMINRMIDDLKYERRDDHHNVLTLEKSWGM